MNETEMRSVAHPRASCSTSKAAGGSRWARWFALWRTVSPGYAAPWLWGLLATNLATYYGTRWIAQDFVHYDLTFAWDAAIPLIPAFSYLYIAAFPIWAFAYLRVAREDAGRFQRLFWADTVAKAICFAVFLFAPTRMASTVVPDGRIGSWLLRMIYAADQPDTLLPSIHCMLSWMAFRGLYRCPGVSALRQATMTILMALICLSTLLIKQHMIVDVPAGIMAAEIGWQVAGWGLARRPREKKWGENA